MNFVPVNSFSRYTPVRIASKSQLLALPVTRPLQSRFFQSFSIANGNYLLIDSCTAQALADLSFLASARVCLRIHSHSAGELPDPNDQQYHPADLLYHPTQTACESNLLAEFGFFRLLTEQFCIVLLKIVTFEEGAGFPLDQNQDCPIPFAHVQYQQLHNAFLQFCS